MTVTRGREDERTREAGVVRSGALWSALSRLVETTPIARDRSRWQLFFSGSLYGVHRLFAISRGAAREALKKARESPREEMPVGRDATSAVGAEVGGPAGRDDVAP